MNTDFQKSAVCGLYCPACSLYIATDENGKRLEAVAAKLSQSVEDSRCGGCRSSLLSLHCRVCAFKSCASSRKISFCSQCGDYPCGDLRDFQAKMPHRAELWESLECVLREGHDKWLEKMEVDHSCAVCGTINSAYDMVCRSCGNAPASPFNARNEKAVKKHLGI